MGRSSVAVCLVLLVTLAAVSIGATVQGAQAVDWANMHGVAYRSGANSLYCVQRSGSCDDPTVAPPGTAFAVYQQNGFNFARISLDWNYMMNDPSGAQAILQTDANACDANGISCYYMWGGSYGYIPPTLESLWGCTNDTCFHDNFGSDAVIPTGSGTPYDGQPIWEALFNGLFKPAIQVLDSHSSTVGYSVFNEPNVGWSNPQLIAYYLYMAQQIRTVSSKAFIFQANGGGSGGSGSASIAQLAPSGYGPYVFEIHNYQGVDNYNPYPSVVSQCQAAGCAGVFLGEWGGTSNPPSGYTSMSQYMTNELNAVKQNGMGEEWFDYSGTNPTTGALTSNLQLLSQIQAQVFGSGGSTTSTTSTVTSITSSSTATTSSATTSTTTSTTSTTTSTTSTTASTSTTSSTIPPSCSPSNVCLQWGYAPTNVPAGVSTQWQGLLTAPSGTNPVGIPLSWYLDGNLVYSTTTIQGGGPTQGVSYFNAQLTPGTHALYFSISNAQSPTITITAGPTTSTTTTTTTTSSSSASTTTSSSASSTTTFLSSSSSSSSSFSSWSYSTTTSVQSTTSNSLTSSTTTVTTPSSQTSSSAMSTNSIGVTSVTTTTSTQVPEVSWNQANSTIETATTRLSTISASTHSETTEAGAVPSAITSAFLFPSTSTIVMFSGAMCAAVFTLVAVRRRQMRPR